ncbi:histidine kinase [Chitinophaga horti]|uniref:Histidine kinase n=1 Tax=Chitinophaga horti TaxID=2920382 RepID=A0ABY6J8K8_9BACT|nr:histidine kinase [Chitinophaga horti]UYQ94619.1 histidine kinase [Chitinophaga horti]
MNQFRKIEFWLATVFLLFVLFGTFYNTVNLSIYRLHAIYGSAFARRGMVFDYYIHYLLPTLAIWLARYGVFVTAGAWIMARLVPARKYVQAALVAAGLALILFLVTLVANSYLKGDLLGVYATKRGAHMHFAKLAFSSTMLFGIMYAGYALLQLCYFEFLADYMERNAGLRRKVTDVMIGMAAWAVLTAGFFAIDQYSVARYWLAMSPALIFCYMMIEYRLLPRYYKVARNRWFFFRELIAYLVLSSLACVVMFIVVRGRWSDAAVMFALGFTAVLVLGAILPLTWKRYESNLSQEEKVKDLQIALGSSSANLDFLRSQINPHFLFNALNTLYGTSLQENAYRTSEGIQKLGDMMRFMLHENHQEQIKLGKELAYLHNYISLQRLRVQESPDIQIEVHIDDTHCDHYIAPMLLIPFVENAFKHGISLRNRSRISITLNCDAKHIYFDVHNTVHQRPDNDPERNSLGIGLNNVKNRLNLLYAKKHELSIRQTAAEFFVHLTIQVSK